MVLTALLASLTFQGSVVAPYSHGKGGHKWIALTFDACQNRKPSGYDAAIVRVLTRTKTNATLFLGGAWVESHAKEARSLGAVPYFEIGQHSYLHPHYPKLKPSEMSYDLAHAQAVIRRLTGRIPKLFRPPYGEWNQATLNAATTRGMKVVLWSIVTGDPDKHITAKDIVRTVLTRAKPGAIVIMHMNGRGWHTAEALPLVIEGLKKKGYTFATVSEILGG